MSHRSAGANGATIAGGGSLTSGNGADLIVNQFDASAALTIGAQITGGGIRLTDSGPGALVLTNSANSYAGGTTISGGTLGISSDGNLGSTGGAVTLNSGTLQAAGSPENAFTLNASRGIALGAASGDGNGTVNVNATTTLTVAGIVSNNGSSVSSLTKTGAGTLILSNGGNSFSGGLNINQGTVVVSASGSGNALGNLGSGTITFNGSATLQFSGNLFSPTVSPTADIVVAAGATATLDNNIGPGGSFFGYWFFQGTVRGQGGLNYISSIGTTDGDNAFAAESGPYTGNRNWTYTGPTTIYVGILNTDYETINGVPFTTLLNPKNVLNFGGTVQLTSGDSPGGPGPTQTLATSVNLIADTSCDFSGYQGQLMTGSTFYLNSVNSNGLVRHGGSTLSIDFNNVLYVANGAASNTNGILGGWAVSGTSVIVTGSQPHIAALAGTDWATIGAGGAITALSSYTSDAWASGNNTSVTMNSAPAANSITNSLRLVSSTATSGKLPLSQTLTLSGPNVIQSGGILVTTNSSMDGSGNITAGTVNSLFTISGGSLTSGNGTDLIVNQFNLLPFSSLTIASAVVNNGATPIGLTLGGYTQGTGGTLILTNPSNSYSGSTVINAATTLQVGAAGVIPANSAVIISMLGTLNLNGFSQSVGSLANFNGSLSTLAGVNFGYGATVTTTTAATLTVGGDNTSTTFNGALTNGTGPLALVKIGSGTLTLGNFGDNVTNGSTNLSNYSGGTTITAGTLDIVYDADLGAVSGPTTIIAFNGNGTLQFNTAYAGTSLSTNRGISITSGNSGTLDVQANTISYAGQISTGSAASNFQIASSTGGGTLVLTSNETYNGITTVVSGRLELVTASNNNIAGSSKIDVKSGALFDVSQVTGAGGFKLASGQSLEGKGNINGSVEVVANSILAPGESVGTLTGTSLLLDPSAILDFEFNASPANDFFKTTNINSLTVNGGGFNLYQENSLAPFETPGTYHVLGYAGTLQGTGIAALAILNPQPGFTYSFSNNVGLSDVDLTIAAVPEPASVVLAAVGALALGLVVRRRRRE